MGIHLREDVAKKMEEENGLMGIYHVFLNGKTTKLEGIIWIFMKIFYDYPLTLSICRQSQLMQTIIISEDEFVFKQYSFG